MGIQKFVREVLTYGAIFFILVTIASIAFYKLTGDIDNYYEQYEVAGLRLKKEIFKDHKTEFNTVFLGSSRTYNQVNPKVFDELTGLKSYNLAFSAVQPFRIFDLIQSVATERPDLDYVFIELAPLPRLFGSFKSPEHLRSVDEHRYTVALDFFQNNNLPPRFQFQSMKDYSKLMAYKYIGFNSAKRWRFFLNIPEPTERFIDFGIYESLGFFPTDSVSNPNAPLRKRQRNFLKHPEEMLKYDHAVDSVINANAYNTTPDKFIEEWYNAIQVFNPSTKVILLIPPRNPWNSINQTAKLKAFLSDKGVEIYDFSNSDDYPLLYAPENSNDEVHLNLKGSNYYTKLIAGKIVSK